MFVHAEMRLRASVVFVFVAAALLSLPSEALAQDDFFKSSPGKLSRSHAEIDGMDECNECHDGGNSTAVTVRRSNHHHCSCPQT